MHSRRHICLPHKTTIGLESEFWKVIDLRSKKSGRTWQEWAIKELASKPEGHGSASWLRVRCLLLTVKGAKHGG